MPETRLRPGWRRLHFKEIAENINERVDDPRSAGVERYVGLEHLDPESLTLRRWGSPTDIEATKLRFWKGDIIFGRRRAYQRKLAVADFDGICSAHAMVLRARPQGVVPGFLPFYLQSDLFMERAQAISVGSLSPTINWKTLAEEEFALPPLEEQRRIVAMLEASVAMCDSLGTLAANAEALLAALRKERFIQRPEGVIATVGAVAEVSTGTTPRRDEPGYWGGTLPWLPTGKVNDRHIVVADQFVTEKALRECRLRVVRRGATLVAMIGEGHTRGRSALLGVDACINQNFAAVEAGAAIDDHYLFYALEAHYERLRGWSHGTSQHALNASLVRSFPLHVPSLQRQREIAGELARLDTAARLGVERHQAARELHVRLSRHGLTRGGE